MRDAAGIFLAHTTAEFFDFARTQVVPLGFTAVRILLANTHRDFEVLTARGSVGFAANAFALAPAAVQRARFTGLKAVALAVAALNTGAALKGINLAHTQVVPLGVAAVRVLGTHTGFNVSIRATGGFVRDATGIFLAYAATEFFDFARTQVVPLGFTAVRILLANTHRDFEVLTARGSVGFAANAFALAPAAVQRARFTGLKAVALAVAALNTGAALKGINLAHTQVVPLGVAAVRVLGTHTGFNVSIRATGGFVRDATGIFLAYAATEFFDFARTQVVPLGFTAVRILLANTHRDFEVLTARGSVGFAANAFALAPAAVQRARFTGLKAVALAVAALNTGAALKGINLAHTQVVPLVVAAVRVLGADTGFNIGVSAAAGVVRDAAGIFLTHAAAELLDLLHAQTIPPVLATPRVLLAHAGGDVEILAARSVVGLTARTVSLARAAILQTRITGLEAVALAVAALDTGAALKGVNLAHTQVVPFSVAAVRILGADTGFNIGISAAGGFVRDAAGIFLAYAATEFLDFARTQVVPPLGTAESVLLAYTDRNLVVFASRGLVGLAALALAFTPAAVFGTRITILSPAAFTITAGFALAAVQGLNFLHTQAVPLGVAAIGVLVTHACFDFRIHTTWSLMNCATGVLLAEAATEFLDLNHALIVPPVGATERVLLAHTGSYIVVITANALVGLTALALAFTPAAVFGARQAIFQPATHTIAAHRALAAFEYINVAHAQVVPGVLATERVLLAHASLDIGIRTTRSGVGHATILFLAKTTAEFLDLNNADAIPSRSAAERILSTNTSHNRRVFAAGGTIVVTAVPFAFAPTAVFGAVHAIFRTAALAIAAQGALATLEHIHVVHAQVVPSHVAAERVLLTHAGLNHGIGTARGLMRHATPFLIAHTTVETFHSVHAILIPQCGATVLKFGCGADAFHDAQVVAAGTILNLTAGAVSRANAAVFRTIFAILGLSALAVAARSAGSATQGINLVNAEVVPHALTAVGIDCAHTVLNRHIRAAGGLVGQAALTFRTLSTIFGAVVAGLHVKLAHLVAAEDVASHPALGGGNRHAQFVPLALAAVGIYVTHARHRIRVVTFRDTLRDAAGHVAVAAVLRAVAAGFTHLVVAHIVAAIQATLRGYTITVDAHVAEAIVAIVTFHIGQRHVRTSGINLTAIIGAGIAIVTIGVRTEASPTVAYIKHGARVAVVAEHAVGQVHRKTLAGFGFTNRSLALARRRCAVNHGCLIHRAQCIQADERPVAQILVLEIGALYIVLARAHAIAGFTNAVLTLVSDCAGGTI